MSPNHSKSLGTLFPNSNRNKEKSPQLLGELKLLPSHLKEFVRQHNQNPHEPINAKLAAWKYSSAEKGQYLVLEIQPAYKQRELYESSDEFQSLLDFTEN